MSSIMPTYGRLPVTFTRGDGAVLFDHQDTPYLDALSGIAVTNSDTRIRRLPKPSSSKPKLWCIPQTFTGLHNRSGWRLNLPR